jgi:flagellar hook-length control protein FliK
LPAAVQAAGGESEATDEVSQAGSPEAAAIADPKISTPSAGAASSVSSGGAAGRTATQAPSSPLEKAPSSTASDESGLELRVASNAADPALAAKIAAAARAARTSAAGGSDSPNASFASSVDSPQAAAGSPSSDTAVNLALAEGSDATGATAAALQSAQAATAAPLALAQPILPQNVAPPDSTQSVSPAAMVAAAPALASGGNDHDRGAAGDSSTGTGDGAAALQQLTANAPASNAPVPTLRVHAEVDSAEFPQAVADRVSFMVDNSWSNAKLSVNPPQLGPIELQIAVQGDHAQVMMSTHSALTRDALESSVPKLREMLNSQGFTQVSVDVSQRSFQERSSYTPPYTWTPAASSSGSATADAAPPAASRAVLGLVDAYA